ncbi:MAG: hypothetical protein Q8O93_02470 [bacterium]|nr:hypothetical protein [bacterium]
MLVTYDLRSWAFRAKKNWEQAFQQNGYNAASNFGSKVFSLIFKRLLKEIATLELPASRPGKYVCDIFPGCGDMIQVVWFEPSADDCCLRVYKVCRLTVAEVDGADSFAVLWGLFVLRFQQGLSDQSKEVLLEIEDCCGRIANYNMALAGLRAVSLLKPE